MTFITHSKTLNTTVEWYDTGITVNSGDTVIISASGTMKPWDDWDSFHPLITPNGDASWPTNNPNSQVYIQGAPFCMLLAKFGSNGVPLRVGNYRTFGLVGSSNKNLYLAVNDVVGNFGDNVGNFNITIQVGTQNPPVSEPPGDNTCSYANAYANSAVSYAPISLYDGEKREEATDLIVNTPSGVLQFARSYRQNKRTNADFQFMGLGWTHNHLSKLTLTGTAPNRTATILLPGGGKLQLTEESANPGHFIASAESFSVLDYNAVPGEYTLTAQDKNKYVFDATSLQLKRIDWTSNDTWTYTYASGKLSEVADGYGRKLVLAYVNNSGQYNNGQLWRIGDHNTTNLTGTPTGRYVELGYTPQKNNGVTVATPKALLASVRDARGNTWTYDWYGQDTGENVAAQLDFLLAVISPSVDITGDGTPDSSVTLKRLDYTLAGSTISSITEKLGIQGAGLELVQTIFDFQPGGLNQTNETTVGKVSKHYFTGSIYAGKADPAGNLNSEWLGLNYRPETRKDGNNNDLQMTWSGDAKHLQQVKDGLGNTTAFTYNTSGISADTLQESLDAQGHKTQYTYGDATNPRLPTRIKVLDTDGTTVRSWREFTYDSKGRVLTEKTLDPSSGTTILQQVTRVYGASGNGFGLLESVTQVDPINPGNNTSTTYTYDGTGRVIKTQQSSLLGTCQFSYTVYDEVGNVVATVCGRQSVTPPTTVAQAIAMYDANDPVKKDNKVTTHEYDTLGRRVKSTTNAGATFAQTTLTVYDALHRVTRTIANYVADVGVPNPYTAARTAFNHGTNNDQNMVTDTVFNARGMVRKQIDVLDVVTLFGYDDAGRLVKTVQSASQPTYDNDYLGGFSDPTLGSYIANGVADQDIVTASTYDKAGNRVKTVDPLGTVHYTVYDVLNRPFKTVRAAKDTATITLNPGDVSYDPANDPRWVSYVPSTSPDRDLIETTDYDALGRVARTQRLLDNRPAEQLDTTLYGYDALGRQVKVIRSASDPNYDWVAHPDLSTYAPSGNADLDIITTTSYDTAGRVLETIDASGAKTRQAYDGLGRQIKSIANYVVQGASDPAAWVWSTANNRWEYSSTNTTAISHGTNNDQNIISETVYDANGRVQSSRDVLGRVALNGYDVSGRLERTITNYIVQGASDPAAWVWSTVNNRWEYSSTDTTPVSHGSDNDQNIVTRTVYDVQGRALQSIDTRNNVTQQVYDVLGRRIKTIVNYIVQGATNPVNWVWDVADNRWEDGAGTAISFGTDKDQNRISATTYDLAGRVTRSRDAAGVETRYSYDALGRRTQTIVNYVDGSYSASVPDEDLISTTAYNKGGQVVTATDARGTQTAFVYDKAGRRLKITQAANNPLASIAYTCYDKAGRVQRSLQNWIDNGISPDAKTGSAWDFVPEHNGMYADRNLITQFVYDLASRRTTVTDPLGNLSQTAYFKDGQVQAMIDPENGISQYRYDGLRRRTRVVQGYVLQGGSDPKDWMWDATDVRWEYPTNNAIAHGTNNDQNIIADVTYDKAGRVLSLREPGGNVTSYAYDGLDRRKSLTNPLSKTWSTAYADLTGGGARVTMTYPGITGAANYPVQRDFDRLGRPLSVAYGAPASTPDVKFTYDNAGNRAKMSEYSGAGFTSRIRETSLAYDDVHRLTSAGFDNDGNGTVDETVAYEYDAGGLRTKLILPGSLNVVYEYDKKGQLISLTDWDSQKTQFAFDQVGRHIATERANGLRSRYEIDAAGRLKRLRHTKDFRTLAHFEYEVDKRGNRIQAVEALAQATTTTDTTIAYNDKGLALAGTWSEVGGFKETSAFSASLKLLFLGDEATLTMGTGPDHGIYDVYVGGSLWQSFDGYAASAGQRDIVISLGVDNRKLQGDGPHLVEIRNRAEKNKTSTGYKVRFKQLLVVDRTWTLQTVKYSYDKLSRLLEARYAPGANAAAVDGDLLRRYLFTHDRAGNRLSQSVALNGGAPTVTNYTYNAANQLTSGSATYDNNGNLTSDGVNSYTWDRANRLVEWDSGVAADLTAYAYDGLGNRIAQSLGTTSPTITKYLLDLQPGLAVVLAETTGANVTRNVHAPRGIHAHKDAGGAWEWMVQDGLGSVRGVVDNSVGVLESRNYDPYGTSFGVTGSNQTAYGFTGEPTDDNGLLHLRARYYNPAAGVFTALDPFEGMASRPMSLNGYSWVEGNTPNMVDPSGLTYESPYLWSGCGANNGSINRSGCSLLTTTLAAPNGLSQLMAQNPGMDFNRAIQTLISAWRACPCEFYSGRGVSSTNDPLYSYLRERLSGIRLDLDNLIVQSVSDRNLWQPYLQAVRNVDYSNPVPCSFYQVSPPSPYVTPPPDTIPCIGFDPSRIQTKGEIISAGLYVIVGVGASIVFVRDDTGREMTLLAFNPGIGLGGKGFSSYAFVSEQRIEDFAGISAGFDINLFIVGASSSYNPTAGNLCSGTTGGGGVAIGLGVSLTISLAGVVYDSNW